MQPGGRFLCDTKPTTRTDRTTRTIMRGAGQAPWGGCWRTPPPAPQHLVKSVANTQPAVMMVETTRQDGPPPDKTKQVYYLPNQTEHAEQTRRFPAGRGPSRSFKPPGSIIDGHGVSLSRVGVYFADTGSGQEALAGNWKTPLRYSAPALRVDGGRGA